MREHGSLKTRILAYFIQWRLRTIADYDIKDNLI